MVAHWRDRLILAAPAMGLAFLMTVSPGSVGMTICPFALFTGTACPGCGMTRACAALLKGDFTTAMNLHPLAPLIALQLIVAWVWYVLRRSGRVPPMQMRTVNVILIATGVALVSVWVVRLVSGTLPPV